MVTQSTLHVFLTLDPNVFIGNNLNKTKSNELSISAMSVYARTYRIKGNRNLAVIASCAVIMSVMDGEFISMQLFPIDGDV